MNEVSKCKASSPRPKSGITFLQDPHAVGIVSFLAEVVAGRDHLGAQPGSQPGLGSLRQLAATHTTTPLS